ncbi:MAG TPA: hypothetical protein VMC62_04740 [Longilinea sp.]|nr:hypothetical protein [Longilinea sp.]
MSNKKWLWVIVPIVVVVLLVVLWLFVFNGQIGKTNTLFPVDVTTPFGTFALTKAEVGESFPEGCSFSDNGPCFKADMDRDVVALYFQTKDSSDPQKYHNSFFDNSASATIVLSDGTKIAGTSGGAYNGQLYLVFFVPKDANDFTFAWYDTGSIHFTR